MVGSISIDNQICCAYEQCISQMLGSTYWVLMLVVVAAIAVKIHKDTNFKLNRHTLIR